MKTTATKLYHTQDCAALAIVPALTSGQYRSAMLVMPTGAGKTKVQKVIGAQLLAERTCDLIVLVSSQNSLVETLAEPEVFRSLVATDPRDPLQYPGLVRWPPVSGGSRDRRGIGQAVRGAVDAKSVPRVEATSDLSNPRLWTGALYGPVVVVSRQMLCSKRGLEALAAVPKEVIERVGWMFDEVQHHRTKGRNIAGDFLDRVIAAGSIVVGATATPFDDKGSIIRPSMFVHAVSVVQWALDPDSKVPTKWKVRRLFVEGCDTRNGDDVFEDSAGAWSGLRIRKFCEAVAKDWQQAGFPKSVFNGPTRKWSEEFSRALLVVKPDARLADLIGDDISPEVNAMLASDGRATSWDALQLDGVVSCVRMNEGRDWPPCTHFYNVGFPNSMQLILQRLGRTSRSKARIKDYAERSPVSPDEQHMIFVTPHVVGDEARDKAWKNLRDVAMLGATYLCSFEEGLRWSAPTGPRTSGWRRSKRGQRMGDTDAAPPSAPEVMKALSKARGWLVGRTQGKPATGAEVLRWVESNARGLTPEQQREVTALALLQNPRLFRVAQSGAARASGKANALRFAGDRGWVKTELQPVWDAVCAAGDDEPVAAPKAWTDFAVEFTAEVAVGFTERLQDSPHDLEENARQIVAWNAQNGMWPRQSAQALDEKRLGKMLNTLRVYHTDICTRYAIPVRARPENYQDSRAQAVIGFFKQHHRWPSRTAMVAEESKLAKTLNSLRVHHQDVCVRNNVPLAARADDYLDARVQEISSFFARNGFWPSASAKGDEKRLGRALVTLRLTHSDVCARHRLPLCGDRGEALRRRQGREQFRYLATLLPRLCQNFPIDQRTPDISGDSGRALQVALRNTRVKPSQSRGLSVAPDLCQVNSLIRVKIEIEHDCWRFTLKGAKNPDHRKWAALLASGDNKKIETAERIAFLDWENPDGNAVTIVDTLGRPQLPATRRPWSPPTIQPEAGKPATPAKGKGKRAS